MFDPWCAMAISTESQFQMNVIPAMNPQIILMYEYKSIRIYIQNRVDVYS